MITRIFGSDITNLELPDDVYQFYCQCWPIQILEKEDDDCNCSYDVRGVFETGMFEACDLTEEELIDNLRCWMGAEDEKE